MHEPIMPAVSYMDMLAEGSIVADGMEQTIIEARGSAPFTLNAWLDLSNMEVGDTLIIRQYARLKEAGDWVKYAEETYPEVQTLPGLFVTTKPTTYGIKITLEQTAGGHKPFDYNIFRQRSAVDRGSIVFTS